MDVLTHSLLPFAGILLALIFIHEAGHYVTAKLFGVKVLEAGVGLPPRLWGVTWRGTEYTVNALPLGGFVRLLGEEDPSDPQSLAAAPKWKRAVILASGAFMNLVLAVILFSVALMIPRTISAGGAQITQVAPDSPAANAGLQPGDQIVKINGRKADSTQDASYLIRLYQGSHIDMTIKRNDPRSGAQTLTKNVYGRWNPGTYTDDCGIEHMEGPTGITIGTTFGQQVPLTADERARLQQEAARQEEQLKREAKPGSPASCYTVTVPSTRFVPFTRTRSEAPWVAVPHAARMSLESVILMRNQIWTFARQFSTPTSARPIGPVGIAQATGEVIDEAGWKSLIDLSAALSMSLGVLNILPIPMLDGGRLLFVFIEFLRRGRRIAPEKEALVHLVGLVTMLTLFVVITYFDVLKILNGDNIIR